MSWLFSRALVEDYLLATSLDGQLSVQLNATPSPQAFLSLDRTMDRYQLSRYGMTCAPLTDDRGGAVLTWFLAVFHAKPIPRRLRAGTLRTISGRRCDGSWQMSLPGTYSPRTSSGAQSTEPQTTLRRWVTPSDAYRYPRRTWVLTTYGSGIGYLHTPTATANYCAPSMQKHQCARSFRQVFGQVSRIAHEWLMGWPMGWTRLEPLETDKFQRWQQSHSPLSRQPLAKETA